MPSTAHSGMRGECWLQLGVSTMVGAIAKHIASRRWRPG